MSGMLEVTLRVQVNNNDEAEKIMAAVYSGYASEILRIGVLYGQFAGVGAQSVGTAPSAEAKRREASVQLKRVDDIATVPVSGCAVAIESEEGAGNSAPERPRGLKGRGRMRRG